jgi:hypothetical protein
VCTLAALLSRCAAAVDSSTPPRAQLHCRPIVGSSSSTSSSSHYTPLWQQQQQHEQDQAAEEEGSSSGTWGRPKEGADDKVGRDSLSADER